MKSFVRRGIAGSAVDAASMLARTRLLAGIPSIVRAIRAEGATVSAAATASARRWGSAVALYDAEGRLSYRELDEEVERVASTLPTGARVAIACADTRHFVIGLAAASRAGVDAVLLGPRIGERDRAAVLERYAVTHVLDEIPGHFVQVSSGDHRGGRGRIIVLSSGTTGAPEPTERPALRLGQAVTAASLISAAGLRPAHPVLLLAPLHHGHGLSLAIASLSVGAPLVLAGGLRMDAALDLAELAGSRVVSGVPAQLLRLADCLDERPRTLALTHIVSGSARLPDALAARLTERFGPVVINFFGSTETGTVTVARARDRGTLGRPVAGASIRIVDATGATVPRGTVGRVVAHSPLSTSRTPRATGDLGLLDASGRLHVAGRADSLVVSGGENVSPAELEDYLLAQPEIEDADVLVIPDERLDAVLTARVVLRVPLSSDTLLDRITRDLGRGKAPRAVNVVDTIPRTATGKARTQQ